MSADSRPRARLNLDVLRTVRDRIVRLRDITGATSITEVIRRSLAVYEVLVDARLTGKTIILRDSEGDERELLIVL